MEPPLELMPGDLHADLQTSSPTGLWLAEAAIAWSAASL